MGKTFRFDLRHPVNQPNHNSEHHDEWELTHLRDALHHNRNQSTTSKLHKKGHFGQNHVWPIREGHKGHKV